MRDGDIGERMFRALCMRLIRAGRLDSEDVDAAADELDAEGDKDAAHSLRCIPIHAAAPATAEWQADRRRKSIRIVHDVPKESD